MWYVVIPTNRPEKFKTFYRQWKSLFEKHRVHLVVVEDAETKSDLGEVTNWTHLSWEDVPDYIPKRTDMIRSWGFYHVYKRHFNGDWDFNHYILTLDDDVVPVGDPFEEYDKGFKGSVFSSYVDVGTFTTSGLQMRGFPYKDRKLAEVAVQYGGWIGVLDYDAATQLAVPKKYEDFLPIIFPVPKGTAATCCIMNTAFRIDYTPIMWQLTMLDGRYNRVGDIWSGLFIKKTLDAMGKVMLINGKASVIHDRASDPYNSLVKEAPSVWLNDNLWDNIGTRGKTTMLDAYTSVTDSAIDFFDKHDKEYAVKLKEDRDLWLSLFR